MKERFLSMFEIVTVGFPFCVFKLLTGQHLFSRPGWEPVGVLLLLLGLSDALLNLSNFVVFAGGRQTRIVGICTIDQVIRLFRPRRAAWTEVAASADVLLSFVLVAGMLGSMTLMQLPIEARQTWTTCTVLNVLGAGLTRVFRSVEQLNTAKSALR